jgi:hypothetical protein
VALSPVYALPGGGTAKFAAVIFKPTATKEAAVTLTLWAGTTKLATVLLTGRGGNPYASGHTLHPVIDSDPVFADAAALKGATVRASDGWLLSFSFSCRVHRSACSLNPPAHLMIGLETLCTCVLCNSEHALLSSRRDAERRSKTQQR